MWWGIGFPSTGSRILQRSRILQASCSLATLLALFFFFEYLLARVLPYRQPLCATTLYEFVMLSDNIVDDSPHFIARVVALQCFPTRTFLPLTALLADSVSFQQTYSQSHVRVRCVSVASLSPLFVRERAIANQGHRVLPLVYPWFSVLWPVGLFFFLLFCKFWIFNNESR